jgi:5-hydroxytryptamine receptor 1
MPLMTVHSLHLRWPFDYRLCYIWMSVDFTCSTASFLTLASMALDRYWALTGIFDIFFLFNQINFSFVAPYFHLRNRSHTSVLIFIISSWAIPFAIWPGSIFLGQYYSRTQPSCVHPAQPFIIVILCAFFYYIPLLFMLACYSRIIVNIKNIEVLVSAIIFLWIFCVYNKTEYDMDRKR